MQYNVAQLMKEHTGSVRKHVVQESLTEIDPEITPCADLTGEVKLLRTVDGVLATGRLQTVLEETCNRCLSPVQQPVSFELEDEFKPSIDIASGASLPVDVEDEDNLIDDHHILDLQEVIRQRLLLSRPLHVLCRPDCQGLCVRCGANLNEGACSCPSTASDPRWAALQRLARSD